MKLKKVIVIALVIITIFSMSGCSFGMLDNDFQYSVVQKFSSAFNSSHASDYSSDRGVSSCESSASDAVSATADEQCKFTWEDGSDGVIITKYIGESNTVTVPDVIDGKSVVGIDSGAFGDRVEAVFIPASITNVDESAFHIGKYILSIEVAADNQYYASHDGILYNKDMSILLRCPAGRKNQVDVPEGVTTIGRTAFLSCTNLKSITLPNGLTSIQKNAFSGCIKLRSISLPASVTSMAFDAFVGCTSLRDIYAYKEAVEGWPNNWVPSSDCNVHLY